MSNRIVFKYPIRIDQLDAKSEVVFEFSLKALADGDDNFDNLRPFV